MTVFRLEQIEDGGFAEVQWQVGGASESVIVHRDGDTARAWLNICPHAGRPLEAAPGHFVKTRDGHLMCAAHGASFELQGGECVAGPCRGQHLVAVPVEVRDGEVRQL
ncbi:ferredoxin [Lysobacteraceae bacterium NML120232]|nr:ferredoxin [Xanthomonadaceae bacterium NML08-0793]PJK09708.1 ferredoxin [Xanthomonadaceae bacterium NML120232]